MSDTQTVYLDHAAATPLDERVFVAMEPYLRDNFYNPSAAYSLARAAKATLEDARHRLSMAIGAKPSDVVLTAGATESINLAIHGALASGGHAVVGATEHQAVLQAVAPYPHSIAKVDGRGMIDMDNLASVIQPNTVLVSITMADSELGTVQPIAKIAHLVAHIREKRVTDDNKTPLYLHSDGSQAAGTLDLNVARLGLDMLSLNAGKCYGPKQVGLLWTKPSISLQPLIRGGGQERGLRSGTEYVAGAVGFALALELAQNGRHEEAARLLKLRDKLAATLLENIPNLVVDGHPKKHLPGHLHISLEGLDAERVVFHLDNEGVMVATGAACAANKSTRSSVLGAIGMTPTQADGSLRITLGRLNEESDIEYVASKITEAITQEFGK